MQEGQTQQRQLGQQQWQHQLQVLQEERPHANRVQVMSLRQSSHGRYQRKAATMSSPAVEASD